MTLGYRPSSALLYVLARVRGAVPLVQKMREYVAAWRRILILARRPDEEEFYLLTKLNLLGFALVGGIAYVIHLIRVLLTT